MQRDLDRASETRRERESGRAKVFEKVSKKQGRAAGKEADKANVATRESAEFLPPSTVPW